MKRIIRLTESDLTRIVERVISETEEKSQKEGMCSSGKISAKELKLKAVSDCKKSKNCIKLGTKSMYPNTYNKIKSQSSPDYPIGCVVLEGDSLIFYEPYFGWLEIFNIICGDQIIKIPKVSQLIKNFMINKSDDELVSWTIDGDVIYLWRYGVGC